MIAEVMQDKNFVKTIGHGLRQVTYLGPLVPGPVLVVGTSNDGPNASMVPTNGDSSISSTSIAVTVASAAAFALLVGSVYYLRRRTFTHSHLHDGDFTKAAGTSSMDDHAALPEKERATSPFSEMLPSAYRFSGNMSVMSGEIDNSSGSGLSAVLENPSGEQSSRDGGESLQMSESGYTTEAAGSDSISFLDMPKTLYPRSANSPLLLGAKKREDNIITAKAGSAEYDELSDVSESPSNSPKGKSATSPILLYPSHDDENDESTDMDDALIFTDEHL
jgi:hypothetical protein